MNKYLLLLILPLLSFIMTGCNDSGDDVKPINLGTFTGTWEVVYQGNQDVLPRDCILNYYCPLNFKDSKNVWLER